MTFKKKKNGGSYVVTWDSDASWSDDDDSDNDKTTKKKALASLCFSLNLTDDQCNIVQLFAKTLHKHHTYVYMYEL